MIFRYKNKCLDLGERTYIMGILNMTEDSFSDGGEYNTLDAALKRVEEMIAQGADIIDVGGESTRPGYTQISDDDEIKNVVPVITEIKKRYDTIVSVDTYKAEVAKQAINAGADIVNDIWGFRKDSELANVCAKYGVGVVLTANQNDNEYTGICDKVSDTFKECISIARSAGIADNRIILDPGFGFGKTYEENIELLNNMQNIDAFGLPILVGVSKKSMIGKTLNLKPGECGEGTIACDTIAIMKGANIIRVHDIKQAKLAAVMTDKIRRS